MGRVVVVILMVQRSDGEVRDAAAIIVMPLPPLLFTLLLLSLLPPCPAASGSTTHTVVRNSKNRTCSSARSSTLPTCISRCASNRAGGVLLGSSTYCSPLGSRPWISSVWGWISWPSSASTSVGSATPALIDEGVGWVGCEGGGV